MKRVKSFDEFVNENLKAAIGSPIKYTKIKNNLKKYQQTKVQKALNDVDFEKKKQKSKGDLDAKTKATLQAANKAKNQALADKGSAIQDRMKDLATTEPLKKVVTIGTTKAKVAAAETALKAADAEETKQLKVQIAKLNQKAAEETKALKDYASTEKDDSEETPAEEPAVQDTEVAKDDDKETTKEEDPNASKIAQLEKDIAAYNKSIETERASLTKAQSELEQANRDKELGRTSDEAIQKIKKRIEDSQEDIAELKKKESDSKKALDKLQPKEESVSEDRASEIEKAIKDRAKPKNLVPKAGMPPSEAEEVKEAHAGESMGDKFRRLMAQHNVQSS